MEAIALLAFVFLLAWWFTSGKKEEVHTDTREVPTTADVITGSAGSSQPLGRTEFAFIDLETTGLDPYSDRIIEVAVLFYTDGSTKFEGYSALANPGVPVPERITELTGITNAMLAGEKSTAEVVSTLLDRIGNRPIAAYNAEFDMAFLRSEATRLGRTLTNQSHCVMEFTKHHHPNLRRYRLQDVCKAFSIEAEQSVDKGLSSHRALYDAERALRLYIAICGGGEPQGDDEDEMPRYGRRLDYGQVNRYHGMRASAKLLYQEAKEAEKQDIDKAIQGYRSAIKLHIESSKVQIYTATRTDNNRSLHPESGDIDCLNRLTMCLCKQGKANEAEAAMIDYFTAFPKDSALRSAEQVRKRVEKAAARATGLPSVTD